MSAHHKSLSASDRAQISAKVIAFPTLNRSEIARDAAISRPTLYAIVRKGEKALTAAFDRDHPAGAGRCPPPPPFHPEGFWIWVDANAIKRAIVALRAICGATHAMIVAILLEVFSLRMGATHCKGAARRNGFPAVREVLQEAYQRAFEYREGVDLSRVSRIALDEMYRWDRCELTGVDADSLFIFLAEKQPGCGAAQWHGTLQRLRDRQRLRPEQASSDGASAIAKAVTALFPAARHVHDVNHPRRALEKVRVQVEQTAYRAIAAHDRARERFRDGPSKRMPSKELTRRVKETAATEKAALKRAESISTAIEWAHGAINVIDPDTGRVNTVAASQATLAFVAKELDEVRTTAAREAASYLRGTAQQIVEERQRYVEVMKEVAEQEGVPWEALEAAARLWELDRQERAAAWPGTRERLRREMLLVWRKLDQHASGRAARVLESLYVAFRDVLAASSAAEWANGRIGAVLAPQKRMGSGFLHLRVAMLNLTPFVDGLRKGKSPHEWLTGERVEDWLEELGYGPRHQQIRHFKRLGWRRLVAPFESTWRKNWGLAADPEATVPPEEAPELDTLVASLDDAA